MSIKDYIKQVKNALFSNTKKSTTKKENNGITMDEYLEGPNAIVFGKDLLEPIKVLDTFAKKHDNVEIVGGIIDNNVADLSVIKDYAAIPSMEGLLTMFAGGLIEHVKNLSIALNLYAEQLGDEN